MGSPVAAGIGETAQQILEVPSSGEGILISTQGSAEHAIAALTVPEPTFLYPQGTWNGMYPVKALDDPDADRFWVPKLVQAKHTLDFYDEHEEELADVDLIIAIARGGLPFGSALAYLMGLKPMLLSQESNYDEQGNRLPDAPPPVTPTRRQLAGFKNILIADEIADSGGTLPKVQAPIAKNASKRAKIRSATLYMRNTCSMLPDMVGLKLPFKTWLDIEEQQSRIQLRRRYAILLDQYPEYDNDTKRYARPGA